MIRNGIRQSDLFLGGTRLQATLGNATVTIVDGLRVCGQIAVEQRGPAGTPRWITPLSYLHAHLCPRQVLGVRMGHYLSQLFDLDLPQPDKRLLALVETDGCFADGVAVATGCWLGQRTLRLIDEGKVAATFVDTTSARAVRIRPTTTARARAITYAPDPPNRWHAYLHSYHVMPMQELFEVQSVRLTIDLAALIGDPNARMICASCGKEISNRREIVRTGQPVCRSCAGDSYYRVGCSDGA